MKIRTKSDGFSLIEVALGLLIIGIIIAPMLNEYAIYKNSLIVGTTKSDISTVKEALLKYAINTGWYPAPAAPGLNSTDVNFGVQSVAAVGAIPTCAGNDTVVCKTPCTGANCAAKGSPPVLIGDIPFATLGLPKQYILDGWGHKLTYAISSNLTTNGGAATFDDAGGVVFVFDMANKGPTYNTGTYPTVPPSSTGTGEDKAHYAVISHGRDAVGAFSGEGLLISTCAGAGVDLENCDNDGTFNNGFAPYYDEKGICQYDRQESMPAGAAHFDDYLGYETSTASDIWTKEVNGATIGNMKTRTDGNVEVATPASAGGPVSPQARIDVRGNVEADSLWTASLCDTSTNSFNGTDYTNNPCKVTTAAGGINTNGFEPAVVGKTPATKAAGNGGIHCGTGNALSGISNADETCAAASNVHPAAGFTIGSCAVAGQYPYGISAAGTVLCSTSPHP